MHFREEGQMRDVILLTLGRLVFRQQNSTTDATLRFARFQADLCSFLLAATFWSVDNLTNKLQRL